MENIINQFDFNGQEVRTIINENNQVFFIAKDICDILGYGNSREAISKHCQEGGVTFCDIPTNGGMQQMSVISESNLYRLVMRSKKKEAVEFQDWVCDEVLPSIRKTGKYESKPKELSRKEIALLIIASEEEVERLKIENAAMKPKVDYLEKEIFGSKSDMNTTTIAKDLEMSAIALNRILHENLVQYYHDGHWVLYAKYEKQEFMKLHTFSKNGKTYHSSKWTEKGRAFIVGLVENHNNKINNSQLQNA